MPDLTGSSPLGVLQAAWDRTLAQMDEPLPPPVLLLHPKDYQAAREVGLIDENGKPDWSKIVSTVDFTVRPVDAGLD